jgi:hypothetical protein
MAAPDHLSPGQFGFVEGSHEDWIAAQQKYDGKGRSIRLDLSRARLHTGQPGIFPDRVKEYVDQPGLSSATSRYIPKEVYQHEGNLWVGEGHHRIAAAIQRGQKTTRARLYG